MFTPASRQAQTNTAGAALKDRSSTGPRPDGGAGGELPSTAGEIPVGGIIAYSGAFSDIPSNWQLCDGTNGTPNLADRFIYGTNTEGDVGDVGGAKKHRHNLVATDTPAGTATAANASAGTPAGAISSVSAGVPSGSIDAHGTTAVLAGVGVDAHTSPGTHTFTGDTLGGHSHTFTGTAMGNHTHLLAGKTALGESDAGSFGDDDVLPPWLKLAWIRRMS